MALRASVLLDFKTAGSAEAKRAVQGIVQATQRAADVSKKAAAEEKAKTKENERALRRLAQVVSETAKAKIKVERDAARAALMAKKQADREATASARMAAKAQADETKKRAQQEIAAFRMMHRIRREQARETARIERQEAATARRDALDVRNRRRGMMQAAAGVATLGLTGINEVRGFGSTLGVRSREEMIQRTMAFNDSVARLGGQRRMTPAQIEELRRGFIETSRRTQADPMQLAEAASRAHGQFSDISFFTQNQDLIAQTANALNSNVADVTEMVGRFKTQMGITNDQIPELIGALTTASQEGAIEVEDMVGSFAPMIGEFKRATGLEGMAGARAFFANAQVLGTGGRGGEGSAVLMQNMLAKLNSADVQRNLQRAGIRMRDRRTGEFVGLPSIIEQLVDNRRTDTATELQGIFGRDMQANQAIGILMDEVRKARAEGRANPLQSLADSSSGNGLQLISNIDDALRNSTSGRARQVGVNAELEFLQNGDALIQSMTNMAGPLAELENRFPRVAQGLESMQGALGNLLAVFAALRLAGGGAVLASTVNAGAGTAMAGAGTAGVGAGSVLPAIGGGLLGWGIGSVLAEGAQGYADRQRAERDRIASSMGVRGRVRQSLQNQANWRGVYNGEEAGGIIAELENARRMFAGSSEGAASLQSVMQKVRDIGALDDIQRSAAGRDAWERAQAQVDRDMRAQVADPIVQEIRTMTSEVAGAVRNLQPGPATGSSTEPTRPP